MILHKDDLIELNYDVKNDVLSVKWPDITNFIKSEAQYSFKLLVDAIRHYDEKKLLIDSRHNVVEIPDPEYTTLMLQFSHDLLATRLQKIARVISIDTTREKKVESVSVEIQSQLKMTLQSKNFTEESARAWLTDKSV